MGVLLLSAVAPAPRMLWGPERGSWTPLIPPLSVLFLVYVIVIMYGQIYASFRKLSENNILCFQSRTPAKMFLLVLQRKGLATLSGDFIPLVPSTG